MVVEKLKDKSLSLQKQLIQQHIKQGFVCKIKVKPINILAIHNTLLYNVWDSNVQR